MPYNMFLDFSVFFGYLQTEKLFMCLITYTKIRFFWENENILSFLFLPYKVLIHFSAML